MRDYYWGSKEEEDDESVVSPHDFARENQAHASQDNNVVEISYNRIYFYSGVTRPKILKLNKGIFNLNTSWLAKSGPLEYTPPPIKLHINSYGGSVFAGLSAVDYIKNSKIPV